MPSRNSLKEFAPQQFYHLYNRGVEKRDIYIDAQDYKVFLGLLKKYLVGGKNKTNRHKFEIIGGQVDLLAYCLMPNHFHLLVYQETEDAITRLMRRVITGYVMYFNQKYSRVGGLFGGRYKASHINADAYLHHISRYLHLNPDDYKSWPYSSLANYQGRKHTPWINTSPILELFDNNIEKYIEFVDDYETNKDELDILKWQLANGSDM